MRKVVLFGTNRGGGSPPADDRFIFTVKTDNAGTSASNQFTIPTSTSGITQAFLYDIETSDGQTITGNTGNTTITFPTAGEYDVKISGSFPYMFFADGGDKLKLLDIKNFGIYALGSTSQISAFWGCSNMDISATDIGHFENVTQISSGFNGAWRSCTSLTSFPLINTSSCTNFKGAWLDCSSLTSFPLLDTSSGTDFNNAFALCSSLESFPLLDFSNGTDFKGSWSGCSSLTSFPDNAFDNNIATNYTNAFLNTNLTTQSIDDILVSLDTCGVSNGTFTQSGGQAPSATGEAAIDSLVGKGWTITVTGGYTPPQLLLDEYPNAAAAYSLRELSNASVGSAVVRVRRSSDNAEQDFTATEITDGTLTTFTGANDGFVTVWYDQSGNSVNTVQATANLQPILVASGILNIDNGKPYLLYDGQYVVLEANNTGIISNNGSIFATYNSSDTNTGILLNAYGASLGVMELNSTSTANIGAFTSATHYTNGNLLTGTTRGDFYNSRVLGQDVLTTTSNVTGSMLNNYIQPYAYKGIPGLNAICKAKEFIIYPSDQSANRTGIETNINAEYTIY
jgi:hypothetical protein